MALPNYLAQIKSSGFYRFVWDKSEIPAQVAQTLRLLVGYSEVGPFNTPVLVRDETEFRTIFGGISKKLERYGAYFHRSALQALKAGPIMCLNLKPFSTETVQAVAFDPWTYRGYAEAFGNKANIEVKKLYNTQRFWKLEAEHLEELTELTSASTNKYVLLTATDNKNSSCTVFMRGFKPKNYDIDFKTWYSSVLNGADMPDYLQGHDSEKLENYFAEVYVFRGQFTKAIAEQINVALNPRWREATQQTIKGVFNITTTNDVDVITLNDTVKNAFGNDVDAWETLANYSGSNFIGHYSGIVLPEFQSANGTLLSLDEIFNSDAASHKMMMRFNQEYLYSDTDDDSDVTDDVFNIIRPYTSDALRVKMNNATDSYFMGYNYVTVDKPASSSSDDKLTWVNSILDVLSATATNGEPGIVEALTNNVDIEYHYLVDTFDSFIETECKSRLSLIAKKKDNGLALCNFPKMKTFTKNTAFYTNNHFDINKVADSANGFSTPSEVNGAPWVGFFSQVDIKDPVTGIKGTYPSAALVSNAFMEKYSKRYPYSIVAGANFGRITENGLVGPDYNYSREDLDVLEPLGVNVLVYVPRKGVYINSNQTAKQNPVTTLSKINIRELCIYLQDEIQKILEDYHWEFNTQTLRETVKSRADVLCQKVKDNGGLYKYYNQCDGSNNTEEVINNEMFVISTSIEPGIGAGKMVQELTLYKKGGMSSVITQQ